MLRRGALVAGLLAVSAVLSDSAARGAAVDDFSAAVPGLMGKTWLDLLQQIFPDSAAAAPPKRGAKAGEMIDLRSIGGDGEGWNQCGDTIELDGADADPVTLNGQQRLIVTVLIADECAAPLAMFDDRGELVAAVNVKVDQHASGGVDHAHPIGAGGALVTATNWHDNSNQSYDILSLILARPGGFTAIGDVLSFGDHFCREQMTQQSSIRIVPDRAPFARIEAEVRRTVQKYAKDCETKRGPPVVTRFRGSWRWDVAKAAYAAHTGQLDGLAAANRKRF